MQSGIFYGYLSLIEGLVARIREERGEPEPPRDCDRRPSAAFP